MSIGAAMPTVPTGLTATAASCNQVDLTWNPSSDASGAGLQGYNVHRNGVFVKQVAAPASWTSDTGLSPSATYSFSVSAVDNAGNQSVPSAAASAATPACSDAAAPSVPTGLTAAAASCHEITLTWNPSTDTGGSGLRGYNFYRNGVFVGQAIFPATSATDPGLAGATFSYRATAVDNAGNESAMSGPAAAATLACPGSATPALVGFVPGVGTARDVAVDKVTGLVYVASSEFGLAVVDVSNPAAPVAVGGANPPFSGNRIAVNGSLAVVTGSNPDPSLLVVDVTDPTAPKTRGALGGLMLGVGMAERYAYILISVPGNPAHTDLAVVDLGNPESPTIVGRITLAGGLAVQAVGSVVYVAAATAGLQIIDVSNPAAPWILSTVDTPGSAKGVAVANGYAYVADETSVQVINVASPRNPVAVASLATTATAVTVAGTRLYALTGSQFKVIDVANPSAPVLLSASDNRGAQALDAAGTLAFLASPAVDAVQNRGGLYVVSAAVPTAPVFLTNLYGGFGSAGVAVSNGLAVATALGLKVVDVNDPFAPRVVSGLSGTMGAVTMAGSYAYVLQRIPGNPPQTDLIVVDLRLPSIPVIVGRVTLPAAVALRVAGSLVYVAATTSGLQIVDVSNPAVPRILRTLDTPGSARGVAVANGYAYVADDTSVQILDIRSPGTPVIVGSVATTARGIAAAGAYVYVIGGTQFKIIDVSNPAAPVLLSATDSYAAQALDVTGTLAFLATPGQGHADPTGGLHIVDVAIPTQPTLLDQIVVPGSPLAVVATPDFVYVGDGVAIVDVIQLAP